MLARPSFKYLPFAVCCSHASYYTYFHIPLQEQHGNSNGGMFESVKSIYVCKSCLVYITIIVLQICLVSNNDL